MENKIKKVLIGVAIGIVIIGFIWLVYQIPPSTFTYVPSSQSDTTQPIGTIGGEDNSSSPPNSGWHWGSGSGSSTSSDGGGGWSGGDSDSGSWGGNSSFSGSDSGSWGGGGGSGGSDGSGW